MAKNKHPGKPHKRNHGQFVAIPYSMIEHPSYKALSPDAKCVLVEMHLGFHGHNNGRVGFSIRQAAECLHSGKGRATRAMNELQERRFIICHAQSSFNMKTKKSREWEITFREMPNGPPSHAWKKLKHGSISDTDGSQAGTVSPKET